MTPKSDAYAARARLAGPSLTVDYYRLERAREAERRRPRPAAGHGQDPARERPPASGQAVRESRRRAHAGALEPDRRTEASELPFLPSRVVLQDFTGVPAVVDLAAMRDAVARAGGDPERINPLVPADLVIDHSVQVDAFGTADAFARERRAASTSATASAISCCAGARRRSRISASSRPAPASCTR